MVGNSIDGNNHSVLEHMGLGNLEAPAQFGLVAELLELLAVGLVLVVLLGAGVGSRNKDQWGFLVEDQLEVDIRIEQRAGRNWEGMLEL